MRRFGSRAGHIGDMIVSNTEKYSTSIYTECSHGASESGEMARNYYQFYS